MPVSAKPSLKLYEKLGEDVVTELVNWFNEVDTTYRSDLKELNEANAARFEAKLDQRTAELRAEMAAGFAELKQQIAGVRADLLQWTVLFWLGTIGIVLLLLRFPGGSSP